MSSSVTSRRSCLTKGFRPSRISVEDALPGLRFLDLPVDPLLDEDALEGVPVPLLLEFAEPDLELLLEQRLRRVDAALEDVADAEEERLVVAV